MPELRSWEDDALTARSIRIDPVLRAGTASTATPAGRPGGCAPDRPARTLRILEVVNDFPPTVGGSETHNAGEVEFLVGRGHRVCVLAVRDWQTLRALYDASTLEFLARSPWCWSAGKVPVHEMRDTGRWVVWSLAREYRRLSRRHGPFDVVVVHRAHFVPAFPRVRRLVLTLHYMELACPNHDQAPPLCRIRPGNRCTCYAERTFWRNLKWRVRQRLTRGMLDAVVTKYPHIARRLIYSGLPATRVHCIPNWIDTSAFHGRRRFWPGMPSEFGIWASGPGTTFAWLGRLHPDHGAGLGLEAFAQACRGRPMRLVIIGDGEESTRLRRRAAEAGVADRVWFLGRIPREHVPAALSWCDAGLATSHLDNYGWRLLEMMAAGLPVVAVWTEGIEHVIEDGLTGYLCGAGASEVAAAIHRLVDDAALAGRIGQAARARIERDFSRRNLVNYEAVLLDEV